jgi:probable rRNA maturation factor
VIHILVEPSLLESVPEGALERAAAEALLTRAGNAGSVPTDLSIVLTDDAHIRALNRDFLGHDSPTDVLSFPAGETDPETGVPYLGDVVISVPRASAQARDAGHELEAEVQLLVVHGVLHLLGHDHRKAGEKDRMWAVQAEILERLGLGGIKIREG